MPTFQHDGIDFHYHDSGTGLPVVFQHGLSGDLTKILEVMPEERNFRLISFDARYHGKTRPLGPPEKIAFDQFADDLKALLDHLEIDRAVIGGISMGAGIALNFATRYPDRVLALILSRPAWLDAPSCDNVRMFPEMAELIRSHGAKAAQAIFAAMPTFARVRDQSSDSASAVMGMFEAPECEETVDRFERIPNDCPSRDRAAWRSITAPTLVLGNERDPIHPFPIAEGLAAEIPGAELQILTPKCVSIPAHNANFAHHLDTFLRRHFWAQVARAPQA